MRILRQVTCVVLLAIGAVAARPRPLLGKTRFVFDGNRMYAELGFVRPDGSIHRALAFVDMGSQMMALRESLFRELQLDRDRPLTFRAGALSVGVPRADVVSDPRPPSPIGSDLQVEAILPARVLQRYQVVIDYRERSLTLALPGTLAPEGAAVPFRINAETGLIAVEASIDGARYAVTIDNGSAYTWVRQSAARRWTANHPGWERGVGAVGASNMMMSGDTTETSGTLLRIPEISLGTATLEDVGALAAGPSRLIPGYADLFDWYSQKNPVAVIGWIGGNVLKSFRLTIDYPKRAMYWLKQSVPDAHDLDQVGLTLRAQGHAFFVAGVATKNGRTTVDGVLPGDQLVRVGDLDLSTATWGRIFEAMHGLRGQSRSLIVERAGVPLAVTATVTAF